MLENLLTCVLIGESKRKYSLMCLLLYIREQLGDRSSPYKLPLGTIQTLTGLSRGVVENTIQRLIDRNVIVQVEVDDLGDCIFYVSLKSGLYEFNSDYVTWKFDTDSPGLKLMTSLGARSLSELLQKLPRVDLFKEIKEKQQKAKLNTPDTVRIFAKKFKEHYKLSYDINWAVDGARMKTVLQKLTLANRDILEVNDFLDWCFKNKTQNTTLNTGLVSYLLTEYLSLSPDPRKLQNRHVDEDGRIVIENQAT